MGQGIMNYNLSLIKEIYTEVLSKSKQIYSYQFDAGRWKIDIGKGYFIGPSYLLDENK